MDSISISDLMHLSIAERLQLVEDLWDTIAADVASAPEHLPVTEGQRLELARRSEALRQEPSRVVPLEEALERIDRSLG